MTNKTKLTYNEISTKLTQFFVYVEFNNSCSVNYMGLLSGDYYLQCCTEKNGLYISSALVIFKKI